MSNVLSWEQTVEVWLQMWNDGKCVGILGQELFGLPMAQKVCTNPQPMGFGYFYSMRNGHRVDFDGGGASKRSLGPDGEKFSWTPIQGRHQFGQPDSVKNALAEFGLSAEEQKKTFLAQK